MWRVTGETGAEATVVETTAGTGPVDEQDCGDAAIPGPRAPWVRRLAAFGYRAPAPAPQAERLVPPMPDGPGVTPAVVAPSPLLLRAGIRLPDGLWSWLCRWSGWLGPLLVALFGGLLRFWHLGSPGGVVFDETYYAKDAYALWHGGFETNWPDNANAQIVSHPQVIPFKSDPAFIVHPPVGKWIIGLGEHFFGMHPFGWRFMVALLGTASILMIARIARRLFRSTLLGCVAGLLLAVDGLHFVMSRTALLDLVVMFWILAGFGFLLLDRDRTRARIARRLGDGPDAAPAHRMRLGLRPYRLAAGVCVGLACSTKWSGMYVAAFFGLLTVFWDLGARRLAGARRPYWTTLIRDGLPAFVSIVVVSAGVYLASWSGWLASSPVPGRGGYGRDWAVGRHGLSTEYITLPLAGKVKMPFRVDMTWVPESLRSLWHYHSQMYDFNVNLHSPHLYQSNPWSWLVLGRPVSFYYESPASGQSGCSASKCASEVLAIGTPLLWWAGVAALAYCLYRWALRRDWRAGAVLCGLGAGYLPWFEYQSRTIFLFYAVAFVPFLVLAVTMLVGALIGPAGATPERRLVGGAAAGVLVLLIVWNFLYFYPLYTGQVIPLDDWRARMWFTSWI
ncbi:phospholipid carrier-dependent glycosyltransferase [Kitasatospora acidiphila]|uniref:Polyprenol-phosphate-mannose--protein mannosyltransferase n=1 Tax=Kitasatospora acidiphila TaxID=2567942 RepID=A0A540W416_9ACTN|nr:phospholipid carrier-dependent glycosyltransferase [Kitasatospora acidiphila]TQF03722.1 phospholipid carrier-dependent glycosyltransferase [Kitasatospora acidiphila]